MVAAWRLFVSGSICGLKAVRWFMLNGWVVAMLCKICFGLRGRFVVGVCVLVVGLWCLLNG